MRNKTDALRCLNVEHKEIEPPFCGDAGIELAQRSGRCISGICEQCLLIFLASSVQSRKRVVSHVNFTANLEKRRRIWNLERQREGVNRLQIFRHIFSCDAIAAGRAPHKQSVTVF